MSEAMTFPETVEEFMEQYKIVDNEQVYTNGAELVPIFRMRQWFEHLGDAVPVVHGHWKNVPLWAGTDKRILFRCSECMGPSWTEPAYCPHCGAKMDEVSE